MYPAHLADGVVNLGHHAVNIGGEGEALVLPDVHAGSESVHVQGAVRVEDVGVGGEVGVEAIGREGGDGGVLNERAGNLY